jgi:hypothetical protein
MGADKRKTAFLMDLSDIVNDPCIGSMTPCAICSNGLVMKVGVTGYALFSHPGEFQGFVTQPAVYGLMLSHQGEIRGVMIER